jgi:hypothetical protein
MTDTPELPIHESLTVIDFKDIYKDGDWWKSVVRYQYDPSSDHEEVAVYLWNKDEAWKRKNKYVIKTPEAWHTDRTIIDRLFDDTVAIESETEFATSDYYTVGAGETVFKSDDWWKAIVKIEQKGDYDTEEVMVYLWQKSDGQWRRRQKYAIKSQSEWEEEADVIEAVLDIDSTASGGSSETPQRSGTESSGPIPPEFEDLDRESEKHLSEDISTKTANGTLEACAIQVPRHRGARSAISCFYC